MEMVESIEKFCNPTASQEAKFPNCPLARESETFPDSDIDEFSSSPDLMPSETTAILVLSLPDSPCPVDQHMVEEGAVFVTPPEHHHDSLLSEQNPNDSCAEQLTVAEAMEASKVRVSEVGLDAVFVTPPEHHYDAHLSEPNPNDLCAEQLSVAEAMEASKVRVSEVGLDEEPEAKRLKVDCGEELDGDTEVAEITGYEIVVFGSVDSGGQEIRATSGLDAAGGDKAESPKNAKKRKRRRRNGSHKGVKSSKVGKKRKRLSPSLEGKEKEKKVVESSEKKSGSLYEFLDKFKVLLGIDDVDGDSEDTDFLATAKRKGMKFPRPRWWPAPGEEVEGFPS